ncbi:hypothetical protein CBR_g54351 [Chara braunii]|uniref:Reverse transcriptase domain-containing protein n=1 Tax=Chara braunii TaxID=69332 RepID=A0A388MC06_CHABU|nr:hypothetical protein CBR_g54351 [Chara braunii]|eukprot:GBG92096.1 hypothetical protein CBR_g54351 [Chara braunii]
MVCHQRMRESSDEADEGGGEQVVHMEMAPLARGQRSTGAAERRHRENEEVAIEKRDDLDGDSARPARQKPNAPFRYKLAQPSATSAAAAQIVASSSSDPAAGATPQSQQSVPPQGQQQSPWYPKAPMKPPLAFSGEKKVEELNTWLRTVPMWVRAKRTLQEEEVITAASYLEGKAAKWLDGIVAKAGFGQRMADWGKTLTLEEFLDMVDARWHNPQQAQIATDAMLRLDQRRYKSVRELTSTVENLIVVPGIRYDDQVLLTMFLRCLPESVITLLASEAHLEYHSFETFSRKALDLEATLGSAQPTPVDGRKKKSPQEWKKKGSRLMMVESNGTQTEIEELTDVMDSPEYDGEEIAEVSTIAAVVRAKAGGHSKGGHQKSQGQVAFNQSKVANWVKSDQREKDLMLEEKRPELHAKMLAAKRRALDERKRLQAEGTRLHRELQEQKDKQAATEEKLALLTETVLHTKQELEAMNKTLQKVESHQYEFEGVWSTFLQKFAKDVDMHIQSYVAKLDNHITQTFTPAVIEKVIQGSGAGGGGGGDGDGDGGDGDKKRKGGVARRQSTIPPRMDGKYDVDKIIAESTFQTGRRGRPQRQYKAQEEQVAAILREKKEKREKKELLEQAKLKIIAEEQVAKKKWLEEEMRRVQQEEEEKMRAAVEEEGVEEEEEPKEEEQALERRRMGGRGERSGTKGDVLWVEKKISEWVANLSLGEDEEAMLYVPPKEKEGAAREIKAASDPLKCQTIENEKKLEWKLRLAREKKRRMEEANRMAREVESLQSCRQEIAAQPDIQAKLDKILGSIELLGRVWIEQHQSVRGQDMALHSIRTGFREFARDVVTYVGIEVKRLKEGAGKFCAGAIEGAKVVATAEAEACPRKEHVKLKFPDSYSGKKDDNFDNWEASVNTYVYLQRIRPEEQVLVAFHPLKDESASFARSLGRAANCEHNMVTYSKLTSLPTFLKLLRERFADVTRGVKASDKLQTIHSRQWKSAYLRLEKGGKVEKVLHSLTLLIEDNLPFDVVLGMEWEEAAGATLHLREHECRLPSPSGEVKIALLFHVSGVDNSLAHCCLSAPAFARLVRKEQLEEQVFVACVRPVTEPKEDKPMDPTIAKLVEEFKDLAEPPTGVVSRLIQHLIDIEPSSRTPKGAVYKMFPRELEELRKQLDELVEKGWIMPSSSPFGAPVLFVPKKEGELWMCINYRCLNAITVKNVEPLPRIDDLLDRVQGCKYFSKIDLKSEYHQIEVHPDDQYKSAFRTRYGHYEFIVMPFGLTNAPATFQRCMNDVFRPWLDRFVVVYLDDVLVFSWTLQEHQGHLRQVLEKLREANFKINAKKCEWAKTQVLYLGHVLDGDGIKPEDSKIAAIRDWPTARTLSKLRSFLGLANYYRKFVRNFSTIAAPLRRLLRKEAIWTWDKDCSSVLKKLKRALIEYPVLKVADSSLPFVITTDTSQYGIGAMLQQDDDNGYRPVEFMSARMPSEKVATSTYERELYTLRQALEHWKHYLLGRHFKVYSDHETLRWLKTQAKMTPKLTRWAAEIDQYDFELKLIKGKYNVVADALD